MPQTRFPKSFTVIDASCLICLLHLKDSLPHQDLLQALVLRYQSVYVPRYVLDEVRRKGRIKQRLNEIMQRHPILEICDVRSEYDAQLLYDRHRNPHARIDRGEAEVITQARELGVSEVLVDDKKGRQMAEKHTLVARGVGRLLVDFKLIGVIEEAGPLIIMLRDSGKLRLGEKDIRTLLIEAGEA